MFRIASFSCYKGPKGSISHNARDFNNMETRAVNNYFPLQGKAPKEIHAFLKETLGEHAPSYATVKAE